MFYACPKEKIEKLFDEKIQGLQDAKQNIEKMYDVVALSGLQ